MGELTKAAYGLEHLAIGERMKQYSESLGGLHKAQLQSHIGRLQRVLDRLQ